MQRTATYPLVEQARCIGRRYLYYIVANIELDVRVLQEASVKRGRIRALPGKNKGLCHRKAVRDS